MKRILTIIYFAFSGASMCQSPWVVDTLKNVP